MLMAKYDKHENSINGTSAVPILYFGSKSMKIKFCILFMPTQSIVCNDSGMQNKLGIERVQACTH